MILFSLQRTQHILVVGVLDYIFLATFQNGLSLFSHSISGLCNQPSLTFPGPPAALATYKDYK